MEARNGKTETDAKESWINSTQAEKYRMLRIEILQYMEEYQTVHNMMYLVTVAILGLDTALFRT